MRDQDDDIAADGNPASANDREILMVDDVAMINNDADHQHHHYQQQHQQRPPPQTGRQGRHQQRVVEEDIIVQSIYKDLICSVCIDVASNIHQIIKTSGGLPPPGKLLTPASNVTSYLQTLELTTGIAARRELYPELYGTLSSTSTSATTNDEDHTTGNQEQEGDVMVRPEEENDVTPSNTMSSSAQLARSDDEIREILRMNAVETPISDLLEGRVKYPFLSPTGEADVSTNGGGTNGDNGSIAIAWARPASKTTKKDPSKEGEATPAAAAATAVDDENGPLNKKYKPDPGIDDDDDDDEDNVDDDDEEYKMEDDDDDGDDDDEKVIQKKVMATVSTSSSALVTSSSGSDKKSLGGGDNTSTADPSSAYPSAPTTTSTTGMEEINHGESSSNGKPPQTTATITSTSFTANKDNGNIIANDIEDSANIVTPDIWGNYPPKEPKDFYCVCTICNRQISTSRFASHLDKCMGLSTRPLASGGAGGSSTRG